MSRAAALLVLALASSAAAQLRVSVPTAPVCAPGSTPVLGIALQPVFDGDYGLEGANALEAALKSAGFRVIPDYDVNIADEASIVVTGEIRQWRNVNGDYAQRVGLAHLVVTDVNTNERLLNLDQDRSLLVFQAPRLADFINSVTEVLKARYCQLPFRA